MLSPDSTYLPRLLGRYQSDIVPSPTDLGITSGVTLIVARDERCPAAAEQGQHSSALCYVPGTAIQFNSHRVITALHSLDAAIKKIHGGVKGPVQVWAMPAVLWVRLVDDSVKKSLIEIKQLGAVQSKGYRSLGGSMPQVGVTPPAFLAIVELVGPLHNLPLKQPTMLSDGNAASLEQFVKALGQRTRMETLLMAGMGKWISFGEDGGDNTLRVRWVEPAVGTWTSTRVTATEFGHQLWLASRDRLGDLFQGPHAQRYAGRLLITDVVVPQGFDGGGVYLHVPAAAIFPEIHPNEPGTRNVPETSIDVKHQGCFLANPLAYTTIIQQV